MTAPSPYANPSPEPDPRTEEELQDRRREGSPMEDVNEDQDPSSGEPADWAGRYDAQGNIARGGVGGTALVPEADQKNPFADEDDSDGDDGTRP